MLTQLAFVYSKSMMETQEKCTQKLTMKTPERRLSYLLKTPDKRWFSGLIRGYRSRRSGGFIVNFEYFLHILLVFPLSNK